MPASTILGRFSLSKDRQALTGALIVFAPIFLGLWCFLLFIPRYVSWIGTGLCGEIVARECVNCFINPLGAVLFVCLAYSPLILQKVKVRDLFLYTSRLWLIFLLVFMWDLYCASEIFQTKGLSHAWFRWPLPRRFEIAWTNFKWCLLGTSVLGLLARPWRLTPVLGFLKTSLVLSAGVAWSHLLASFLYMLPFFGVSVVE